MRLTRFEPIYLVLKERMGNSDQINVLTFLSDLFILFMGGYFARLGVKIF